MVVHPQVVTKAHLAGCAAAKQGKFAEFYKTFWEKSFEPYAASRDPSKLDADAIFAWAPEAGLDVAKMKADMEGQDCQGRLAADASELGKFQVNSTPTFFVNGIHIGGALPKESFKQVIDERLKIAEASGVPAAEYYQKEVIGKGVPQFRSKGGGGGPAESGQ